MATSRQNKPQLNIDPAKGPAPRKRKSTKSLNGPISGLPAAPRATGPDRSDRSSSASLGENLYSIRNGLNLTLAEAAQMTGTGASTLSKIENGKMSPTYDVLQKIVKGLQIDLVDLFDRRVHMLPSGRRAITHSGTGTLHATSKYVHELLATELSHKKFLPFHTKVTARVPVLTPVERQEPVSHPGEEFVFVLSGAVELHTDCYAPSRLEVGDSVYFDSGMLHSLVSVSPEDAQVLWIVSQN